MDALAPVFFLSTPAPVFFSGSGSSSEQPKTTGSGSSALPVMTLFRPRIPTCCPPPFLKLFNDNINLNDLKLSTLARFLFVLACQYKVRICTWSADLLGSKNRLISTYLNYQVLMGYLRDLSKVRPSHTFDNISIKKCNNI